MDNEPRTWKYMLPGMAAVLFGVLAAGCYQQISFNEIMPYAFLFCLGMVLLCGVATVTNWWRVWTEHMETIYERRVSVNSMTPTVKLAESLKQMHPEAVKVLNRFGVRTVWDVKINANTGERQWILQGTNVNFGFIEYIMEKSTSTALFPKRMISEGSYKWDPDHMVSDRDQYEQFELWLYSRLIITRNHGEFKPAEFIPPWHPQAVLELMGLVGEQDLYRPEENGRKDLNGIPQSNGYTQKAEPAPVPVWKDGDVTALTDQEIEAIQSENEKYQQKFRNGGNNG
jgi:hypothetical protein